MNFLIMPPPRSERVTISPLRYERDTTPTKQAVFLSQDGLVDYFIQTDQHDTRGHSVDYIAVTGTKKIVILKVDQHLVTRLATVVPRNAIVQTSIAVRLVISRVLFRFHASH